MKTFSEIKYQLDVGNPIAREVFLYSLSNLKEAFIKKGPGFNDEVANKEYFEAINLFIEEMKRNGFLGPTEQLFDSFWRGLHSFLLERYD